MKAFFESVIGFIVVILITSSGTLAIYHTMQSQRELEQLKIEFQGYRDGVKDSR